MKGNDALILLRQFVALASSRYDSRAKVPSVYTVEKEYTLETKQSSTASSRSGLR